MSEEHVMLSKLGVKVSFVRVTFVTFRGEVAGFN
jgi:hypothetical protein